MRHLLILTILLIINIGIKAQVISGFVEDIETRERLEGANIYTLNPIKGTTSNYYGYYNLMIENNPYDSIVIYCSFVGYETKKYFLNSKNTNLIIKLESKNTLDEVIVLGEQISRKSSDIINIPIKQLKSFPTVFGEIDINKSLQFLPGIGSGLEGSSGLHIRGGSPDQNLVLLDDAVVFNASHFANLMSIFNSDAIKSYKIYKGYIPAKYGERISSVLDIKMNEGSFSEHKGAVNLGMISSGLLFQGPVIKEKLNYLISARLFNYGYLTNNTNLFNYSALNGYSFYDLNAKFGMVLSNSDRLMFSFYHGRDISNIPIHEKIDYKENLNNIWGNSLFSARWNHTFNSNLFSNTTFSINRYDYSLNNIVEQLDIVNIKSNKLIIPEIRIKSDYEYSSKKSKLNFGFGATNFQYISFIENEKFNQMMNNQLFLYFEENLDINEWLFINAGLRNSFDFNTDTSYLHIEPRIMIQIKLNKNKIDLVYTQSNQNLQYLSNQSGGKPVEYWIPAGKTIDPIKSVQYAINFSRPFIGDKINIEMSGYYKQFKNLIWIKENQAFSGFEDLSSISFEKGGIGKAFGAEFLIKSNFERVESWFGYTLSKSVRKFNEFNNGNEFPYDFDRRHNIDFFTNIKFLENLDLSIAWEYGSGFPITVPVAEFNYYFNFFINDNNFSEQVRLLYTSKNNFRMADYHKLDIGLTYTKKRRNSEITYRLGVNNAYNRNNPYYYNFRIGENGVIYVENTSMFPIMPYFGFKWEF